MRERDLSDTCLLLILSGGKIVENMVKNQAKEKDKKNKKDRKDKIVLVAVLKNKSDLVILLSENWYRIPAKYAPKSQFNYLAFYQPALFGCQGKRIQYYARVSNCQITKRGDLLPDEVNHPKAHDDYFRVRLSKIKKLAWAT